MISLEISIAYINHNLRYDVENDLKFINEFASKNNVNHYIESIDVKKYATENKKSVELAARELRYETIENIRKKIGYNKIATGHNLDDNVETFEGHISNWVKRYSESERKYSKTYFRF